MFCPMATKYELKALVMSIGIVNSRLVINIYLYRDIIYNLYQDMCTYSKQQQKNMCIPQEVNGAPCVPKLYASSGIDISKCIEDGSMKLSTLVDYIYVCAVTNAFPCNECKFKKILNH